MHLKTLGSEEHTMGNQWQVIFHDEFYEEYGAWPEVAKVLVPKTAVKPLDAWSAVWNALKTEVGT